MLKSIFFKYYKWFYLLAVLIVILAAVFFYGVLNGKPRQVNRRELETGLVKVLKNTYKDIEEIQLTSPHYHAPDGLSCHVNLRFSDNQEMDYDLGYSSSQKENDQGSQTDEGRAFLKNRKGKTKTKVSVTYPDGDKGRE
ncbi:hypothetical protein ACVRXQ_02270 [Streptococcus panodentis]|uniref:DUF1310 family protein n=1 Tax=Streptococcus panodentis TaxID=1581472 RepID=A0ABS5ATV1_9STRE|nr:MULTISPECIES: hypothetical protein [Streptococcus]KXT85818.1 hypothetical protein STRDD11_00194 [Streptococcus sp. DD11]MBP2620005.1 hypothetical protein [Streptococcus panodentis]